MRGVKTSLGWQEVGGRSDARGPEGKPVIWFVIGAAPDGGLHQHGGPTEGFALEYCEYKGLFHVWVAAPIPEAKEALEEVAAFVRPRTTN